MSIRSVKKRGQVSDSPSSQSKFEALIPLIHFFKEKHNLTKEDLVKLFEDTSEIKVPLSIFSLSFSPLESLVKYLKENLGLRYHEIASDLNRDDRSIWRTYQQAKSKSKVAFESKKDDYMIQISIFRDRKSSVLENLVVYLKDGQNLTVREISTLTNKSVSTIWTVYNRAKKKAKNE